MPLPRMMMPRFRFRIRTLMIAVAVVAIYATALVDLDVRCRQFIESKGRDNSYYPATTFWNSECRVGPLDQPRDTLQGSALMPLLRMPMPRFKIRTLMIAVAATALFFVNASLATLVLKRVAGASGYGIMVEVFVLGAGTGAVVMR